MNAPIQTQQSYRIQELEATIEQQAKRIEELSAQIALAREALRKVVIVTSVSDAQSIAVEALSTLTTGNAVQAIKAREERFFPFEFEVWQDDMMVSNAIGPRNDAAREAMHYAAQYGQDGPVRVFEVTRTPITADELRKLAEQKEKGA